MSVILLVSNGPEPRRKPLVRWLGLLGQHALDVRTSEEATMTLRCVQASLVIVDATPDKTAELDGNDDGGEPEMSSVERNTLDVLEQSVQECGYRPPVLIVGAPAQAYRWLRAALSANDRFLSVAIDSDAAKSEIADFIQARADLPDAALMTSARAGIFAGH